MLYKPRPEDLDVVNTNFRNILVEKNPEYNALSELTTKIANIQQDLIDETLNYLLRRNNLESILEKPDPKKSLKRKKLHIQLYEKPVAGEMYKKEYSLRLNKKIGIGIGTIRAKQ